MKLIGEGREAEVFLYEGKALRLLRSPRTLDDARHQAAAMNAAEKAGVGVPRALEVIEVRGRPGLVMDLVSGEDMLTILGRRPWMVWEAGKVLGGIQSRLHTVEAPESLLSLNALAAVRIAEAGQLGSSTRERVLELLEGLPDGDRLCHGDFHPGNVIQMGEKTSVIDWTGAARGHPTADLARSWVLWTFGTPPPGSPAWLRLMVPAGGRILGRSFLNEYQRSSHVDQKHLAAWAIVRAAERLSDGIETEYRSLVRYVESRLAGTSL